jgi:hypothetical protein
MPVWTYWEEAYRASDPVDIILQGAWTPGVVDPDWTPAPGFGVNVILLDQDGSLRVASPADIRHRGASAIAAPGGRMLLKARLGGKAHSWPVTVQEHFPNGVALVSLEGLEGRPMIAKAGMLHPLKPLQE